MQRLARKVSAYVQEHALLRPGDRVGVAVSGGLDSVALLRLLINLRHELGVVLSVVHFNHKLRGEESEADERFVSALAREHDLLFRRGEGQVREAAGGVGLEAAARNLRYGFFDRMLQDGALDRIATAHTIDDQAETVLLRLARGSGTRGLAGIYPRRSAAKLSAQEKSRPPSIIRPLLNVQRSELAAYLAEIHQSWREDSSNRQTDHLRNRVRHELLPWLEQNLNPAVRERLAETAEIARSEEDDWQQRVDAALAFCWNAAERCIEISRLVAQPPALQRRVVRAAAESLGLRLQFQHVGEILAVAVGRGDATRSAVLPSGWMAFRELDKLRFRPQPDSGADYCYPLPVPGNVEIPEAGAHFEFVLIADCNAADYDPENLFDPAVAAKDLRVRNWQAGDRFWACHSKGPRRIKELLQRRHVVGESRRSWPVIASGEEVVWMRGFGAAQSCRLPDGGKQAVLLRETELEL